ncbi:MAG: GtrA family protein [Clostridia bacterium]|nr:GtrA family protein [Clostridia bacterium]
MKKNTGLMEGLRFLLTGGVCFLVEFACLVFLRDTVGLDTLIATPIAFLISVILNYLLCVKWVFGGAKDQGNSAKLGFLVTSVMGLFLNELLMLIFRGVLGEDAVVLTVSGFTVTMYMINKVLSTGIVMVWNYFTKRAILKEGFFHKKGNK